MACCETPEVHQLVKASLDQVVLAIESGVVRDERPAAPVGGDRGFHPRGRDGFAYGIAFTGLVGNDRVGLDGLEQGPGGTALVHLATGQKKAQRWTERIGERVNLGRQATSGTPQSLVRGPSLAAPLLVAACWWVLTRLASSITYSFFGSSTRDRKACSHEPFFAQRVKHWWTLFRSVPLGQLVLLCSGARHSEDAIDERALVGSRSA